MAGRPWLTSRGYAKLMGLPYPIRMRSGSIDLKPGRHPVDRYLVAAVQILGKKKAAAIFGVKVNTKEESDEK